MLEITREHLEPIYLLFVCIYKSIYVCSSHDLGEGSQRGKHEIMARGFS